MKAYSDVQVSNMEYTNILANMPGVIPVAIELVPGTESLPDFVHPEDAIYLFGPEDGSLERPMLMHCHKFVSIPSAHCMNLASAVYVVLYDRLVKQGRVMPEAEHRWIDVDDHDLAEVSL